MQSEIIWFTHLLIAGVELAGAFRVYRWICSGGPKGLGFLLTALLFMVAVRLKVLIAYSLPGYPIEYAEWMDVAGRNGDKLLAWPFWILGVWRMSRDWAARQAEQRIGSDHDG